MHPYLLCTSAKFRLTIDHGQWGRTIEKYCSTAEFKINPECRLFHSGAPLSELPISARIKLDHTSANKIREAAEKSTALGCTVSSSADTNDLIDVQLKHAFHYYPVITCPYPNDQCKDGILVPTAFACITFGLRIMFPAKQKRITVDRKIRGLMRDLCEIWGLS